MENETATEPIKLTKIEAFLNSLLQKATKNKTAQGTITVDGHQFTLDAELMTVHGVPVNVTISVPEEVKEEPVAITPEVMEEATSESTSN